MTRVEEYTQKTIELCPFTAFLYNNNIAKHKHAFFEFVFCLSGEIVNVVNEESFPTRSFKELIFLRPGDTHQIIRETKDEGHPEFHRDVYCQKEKMKRICDFLRPGLYEEIMNEKKPIVIRCKREWLEALENSLNSFPRFTANRLEDQDAHHTVVMFQILDLYLTSKMAQREPYPRWIEDFLQSLNNETVLCMSLNEIIGDLNYSRGHICREFKKHVGKTMVECLNEARVFYASMLLRNSDLSILDVAMRLNFSSQGAFTNAFKKVFGVSPRQWRANERQ